MDEFIFKLTCADWSQCFNACNINTAWSASRDIFLLVINYAAPIKEVRLKKKNKTKDSSESGFN